MENSKLSIEAALKLVSGNLVAFPTETVYGLGADACNGAAVARIYAVKGRPTDHPLIVHVASKDSLLDWAVGVPQYAFDLARDYWPGPMTLILKRSALAANFLTGGQATVGVRVPNHPVALELLESFAQMGGKGIAAPSANRFGRVSPTTVKAVLEELGTFLGHDDQVLDGGACAVGLESTIVDCTGDIPRIVRPGFVTTEMIRFSTDLPVQNFDSEHVEENQVSGTLESHYAPQANVVLDQTAMAGQGFIAMAGVMAGHGVIRLASPQTNEEFASVLYSALRAADERGLSTVVVAQPEGDGIAIAIRDRLKRAAHR